MSSTDSITDAGRTDHSTAQLLAEFEGLGVRLWHESGQLHYRAPQGVMTPERLARLRDQKAEMLEHLSRVTPDRTVPAHPEARHEPFPLTEVQSAYLLGRSDMFDYGGVACHGYLEIGIRDLDPGRLDMAWQRVVARHDMLRAVVHSDGYQQVLPELPPQQIPVIDLRGATAEQVADGVARTRRRARPLRPPHRPIAAGGAAGHAQR